MSGLQSIAILAAGTFASAGTSLFMWGLGITAINLILLLALWFWLSHRQRKDQRRVKVLFAALPIHVGVLDEDGNILFLQDGTADNALGSLQDLPVELSRELAIASAEVFANGKHLIRKFSVFNQHRQLEVLPISRNIYGRNAVMWISSDVTELHNAFSETASLARRSQLILESIGDAVIVTDCDGNITLLNPAAELITGYSSSEAVGSKIQDIFQINTGSHRPGSVIAKVLRNGSTVSLSDQTKLTVHDGSQRRVSANIAPMIESDGMISGAVLFFRDETDEFRKRDLLQAQNTILHNATAMANLVYFKGDLHDNYTLFGDFRNYWGMRNGKPLPPQKWIAPEYLETFREARRNFLRDESGEMLVSYRGLNNRYYEMRVIHSRSREFYGIIQDVSVSRENEFRFKDNAIMLKSIMDNLPGGIFVKDVDDNFRYLMSNRNFDALINPDGNGVAGLHSEDVYRDKEIVRQIRESDLALARDGKRLDFEMTMLCADGKRHVLRVLKAMFRRSDGRRLIMGVYIDITEQEIQRQRLQEAMEIAQAADRAKNHFIAAMSHEIRSPLNVVIGLSELMQQETLPPDEQQRNLAAIYKAGNSLLCLINDVLDLSKLEADSLVISKQPLDLHEMLAEMLMVFRQANSTTSGIRLDCPAQLPWLEMDGKRLRQILVNLIGTALRATDNGSLSIAVAFTPQGDGGELQIRIEALNHSADELPLMPAAENSEPQTSEIINHGDLELSLARRICDRMAGRVEYESISGGICFVICFHDVTPLNVVAAPDTIANVSNVPQTQYVLLVDDVPMNLTVLSALLRRLGIEYLCCSSAHEALRQLNQARPAAIFTDLWMPDMSGDELALQLSENQETASIPVIAVSADNQIDPAVQRHFRRTVIKPVSLKTIRECLTEVAPGLLVRNEREA